MFASLRLGWRVKIRLHILETCLGYLPVALVHLHQLLLLPQLLLSLPLLLRDWFEAHDQTCHRALVEFLLLLLGHFDLVR